MLMTRKYTYLRKNHVQIRKSLTAMVPGGIEKSRPQSPATVVDIARYHHAHQELSPPDVFL